MAATRMALATMAPAEATGNAAMGPRGRRAFLGLGAIALALLSLAVGMAALETALGLADLPHPLAMLDARLPVVFRIHMLAGALGLMLLPVALALRGVPWLHRRLGRAAAALLLVAALAGVPSALASEAAWPARLGFLAQGTCCATFLALAWCAIRRRDAAAHARHMARAAAIVSGVIWLRLAVGSAVALQLPFYASYAAIAWASWLVPLLAVWFVGARRRQHPHPHRAG
jgi:hypothetical protein